MGIWWILSAFAANDIVGGDQAAPGDWPDAAGVMAFNYVQCTGTLIAPNVVITAGHCIGWMDAVVLDSVDWTEGGEKISIIEQYAYDADDRDFDVGILILEEPSTITPRPIALDCIVDNELIDGAEVALVGFGATTEDANDDNVELNEVVTTIQDADCSSDGRGCEGSVQPGGELIAGGDGLDSCNGDSGGPLYLLTEKSAYLAGVTSRASYPAENYCGDGGIYVRPDAVIDWIEGITGRYLPRPECDGTPNLAPEPSSTGGISAAGTPAIGTIQPHDPDASNRHMFEILTSPEHGTITLSNIGEYTYTPDGVNPADDLFTVRVTDNGTPPLSADVNVVITQLPRPGTQGTGCVTVPPTTVGGLAIALLFVRRRSSGSVSI